MWGYELTLSSDNPNIADKASQFKNREINEFCGLKGIKREFSVARTPQQNRVDVRKNRTLIEAARTMLADSLLPTVFWAEAVNTACYVLNRNLHVNSLENKPNVAGQGPNWLFDIDSLTNSMNYQRVTTGNQTNKNTGPQEANGNTGLKQSVDAGQSEEKNVEGGYKSKSDAVRKSLKHNVTVNAAITSRTYNDAGSSFVPLGGSFPDDPLMPDLEDIAEVQNTGIFGSAYDDEDLDTYNSPYADQVMGAEEVYVSQPPGFVDPEFLEKVYKVEKALYGLHQAPKAWYETLSTYLLDKGFYRGQIDKTLFIKRVKGDILLVQVYVDNIIFGSSKKSLCTDFKQIMHKRFQMSSIGELTFFLGLQVKQKEDGIFISQDKYVGEILKKFGFSSIRTASTPMETNKALTKDEDGKDVDIHLYRSMIGSLMYLTSSRPDIIDYAGASLDRKSTTRGCQFLGSRLISWQCKKQTLVANSTTKAEYIAALTAMVKCFGFKIKYLLTKAFDVTRFQFLIASIGELCLRKKLSGAMCKMQVGSYTTWILLEWSDEVPL
ncbi:putative ribonuclease H-like domain-containing protein [Tanacetum coccineum]|uniref:Ribonuclease H-like domain-containing protein n=1 Tax=Tanacetum coccineum TaxID=301880 RepID=A0ABQ5IPX2_9ASTR